MSIKLVIFDLDGVLVDACEWHRVSLNEALKEICNYEISLQDHYREYNGIPTKVKLKKLADKNIISSNLFKKIEYLKQEKTIEIINTQAYKREEKIKMMQFLKNRNIKIACYTNSIRMTAELMLRKTGIIEYFDMVITNQDVAIPKPSSEGYIKCMNNFNLTTDQCLIVEDSPNGLEAARGSGAMVIKVKNPSEVNEDLFKEYII